MTDVAVATTDHPSSEQAGRELGEQLSKTLGGERPDAVVLFASTRFDYPGLLAGLHAACDPALLVGGSSAGEFTREANAEGTAVALAFRSDELHFAATAGRGLRGSRSAGAEQLVAGLVGLDDSEHAFRSALVLTDAMAGHADELVGQLTHLTAGTYQLFGGGVGGDARFAGTRVFLGREVLPDAVVALEILSNKPLGVGVAHGWQPASDPMRVTEAEGTVLRSLNAEPAAEVYARHAAGTGQRFERDDALPFFLHNILGVVSGQGHKLRVPMAVEPDEALACATEVPAGSTVQIMGTSDGSAAAAARRATEDALSQLGGHRPKVALFFDCVATRLRLGQQFEDEVAAVRESLGSAELIGCNSIGQIARAHGQFSGFHNCTAVVCVIPG